MIETKDFFGKDVTEAISLACEKFSVPQDKMDIDVLETGSAGIFGLCKKKAHIRVSPKEKLAAEEINVVEEKVAVTEESAASEIQEEKKAANATIEPETDKSPKNAGRKGGERTFDESELPDSETLGSIRTDIEKVLELMNFSSEVSVELEGFTVQCQISGEHEENIIGTDGRTLDSLQYLIRKMVNSRLPERMPLYLDAGNFRERRVEELKKRALELAEIVKEEGKTQAIPALNPSERRIVHLILQEDKGIRSRSVGEGLFKKVLIYKPGKNRKPGPRKRRSRSGGRPENN